MADPSPRRRVVLLGKNALAVGCLEVLLEQDADVVLVVADPSDEGIDDWQPSLVRAARDAGIEVRRPISINSEESIDRIAALEPDVVLSCQYAQILGAGIRGIAAAATLNLHFGPLPRYRGVAPIYWAIHNGESETGVTLHHVDAGIDSGDIVAARAVPIHAHDTARDLYLRSTDAGIDLLRESWPLVITGRAKRQPQDPAGSLYYNRHSVDYDRRRLGWHDDAETIANRARALIFPPLQYPEICVAGEILEVGNVSWDRVDHPGRPGQILDVDDLGFLVAAPGGRIRLGDLHSGGRPLDADALDRLDVAPGLLLE
ncbi:MAG TPA: methionyl-tRNA formyltransferase [Candidatus Limnocylindrales bacterium]|jgi:methionyl-tRNA formyltransferase